MTRRTRGPVVAGALSMLLPGAGQLYAGAQRRGVLLLSISAVLLLGVALAAARPLGTAATLVDRRLFAALLFANLALLGFRLFAVTDAWRRAGGASAATVGVLAVLAGVTAAPHVAAAYVTVRGHALLESVFADEEPGDVLGGRDGRLFLAEPPTAPEPRGERPIAVAPPPARSKPLRSSRDVIAGEGEDTDRPWVTVLLLGSDAGPDQWGTRTDSMIVAALQRGTGRAAAFGVPRNLVELPLAGRAGRELVRLRDPLNALYGFAHTRPELFPGGRDPGATALKQTISRLLGIRIDYYALVDLRGFADLVDVLGGVDIHVKERLVDEVTRPRLGVPKPRIDVHPGRTYHFSGETALAYVRSRKSSTDYARMARQRCFLSAMAEQFDVVRALRYFNSFARTVERTVETDIPLRRLPDLMRLVSALEPRQTVTETFGLRYFARRRAADRYPIPNAPLIRAAVRDAILLPPDALAERKLETVARSC